MAKLVDIADGFARFDDGETLALPPKMQSCRKEPSNLPFESDLGVRWHVWFGTPGGNPKARGWIFPSVMTREQVEAELRILTLSVAKGRLRELAEDTGLSFVALAAVAKGLESREVRDGQATFPGRGR